MPSLLRSKIFETARDIYSAYYDMMKNYSEYILEEKQCLLRNIVENVLNVKQDIPIERCLENKGHTR